MPLECCVNRDTCVQVVAVVGLCVLSIAGGRQDGFKHNVIVCNQRQC